MVIKSFLILFCCIGVVFSQIPSIGIIAYFPFNGNANDISSKGLISTVNGATLASDRFGSANNSYAFNGTSNYISVTSINPLFGKTPFTISVWINYSGISTSNQAILGQNDNGAAGGWSLGIANNSNQLFWTQQSASGANFGTVSPSGWHHIVAIRNGDTMTFYIDNANTGSKIFENANYNLGVPLDIGASVSTSNVKRDFFNGSIDDIRIYTRAITRTEVTALYNDCDIIAYYLFNGSTVDESGNGNDGVTSNAKLAPDRYENPNSAFKFDGTSSYIYASNINPLLGQAPFTISVWINYSGVSTSNQAILGQNNSGAVGGWSLGIANNTNQLFWTQQSVSGKNIGILTPEKWHHIIALRNGDSMSFYIDTVSMGSKVFANADYKLDVPLVIGASVSSSNIGQDFLKGSIDDIRIYDRIISRAELIALFNENKTTTMKKSVICRQPLVNVTAFPNPMHSLVNIRFLIPTASLLDGFIYDETGKLVKNVFNGLKQPGIYSYVWDGTNCSGGSVANGTYFFRVRSANEGQIFKKIAVMK